MSFQEILNKVEKSLKEKTMQANEKKVKLKQKCHDKLPNEKDFPYRKEFAELPNDLEELEERREQLISRMGLINCDAQVCRSQGLLGHCSTHIGFTLFNYPTI